MSEEMSVTTTRVVRTFAFIDRAVEVLRLFRVAVREAASSRGVRVAKWLGNGAMLVGVDEPVAIVRLTARV